MIVTYLPTDKVIKSMKGDFVIKETEGYELWYDVTGYGYYCCVATGDSVNDFRDIIGEVVEIGGTYCGNL